jgi:hypothetical protein
MNKVQLLKLEKNATLLLNDNIGLTPLELSSMQFTLSEIAQGAFEAGVDLALVKQVTLMSANTLAEVGYTANQIRAAGYSESELQSAGFNTAEVAASASFAPPSDNTAASSTSIVVAVVAVLVATIIIIAVVMVNRSGGPAAQEGVVSFENPMYSDVNSAVHGTAGGSAYTEPAYTHAGDGNGGGEGGQQSGYMDVNPMYSDAAAGGGSGSGYMDVTPQTAAYTQEHEDASDEEV